MSPSRERELKRSGQAQGPSRRWGPRTRCPATGGRRATAWLKDGELGKWIFEMSQRLGGAEGALRSGRRMSHVGQVCLSLGRGQARAGRLRLPQWREVGSGDALFSGSERQQGECGPEQTWGQGQPGWRALRGQEARLGGGRGGLDWAGSTQGPRGLRPAVV